MTTGKERKRFPSKFGRRHPQKVGDLLGRVMARWDYGSVTARGELEESWTAVAGPAVAGRTKVGSLKKGVLEILVDNSVLLQQLDGFQKHAFLAQLQQRLKHNTVSTIRFRRT